MTNPLLDDTALPLFSQIAPDHIEPAIDALLARNRDAIEALLAADATSTWESLVEPIEEIDNRLTRAWSPVSHLNAVMNSEDLRAAYNACLPKLSEYATEIGQNAALYRAYQAVAEDAASLDPAQRKVLENILRDFRLSGVDLAPEAKARFKEISQSLSRLTSQFSDNLLDATNAWSKGFSDPEGLAGLPASALEVARQAAEQQDAEGWMLTLDMPCYQAVMTYAEDRDLRREMYQAYNTRASDQGPHAGRWDNSDLMREILTLRTEMARILGYANYAELSLARKMARSTDEVLGFLQDLARRSRPQAEAELAELREFACECVGLETLEPWDIPYCSEKLRKEKFDISQEELKPYFPHDRVIAGMFEVIGRLFGVRIAQSEQKVDIWHPEVRFYDIRDAASDELRGQFYFDLFARRNKRGGAWMDDCQGRMRSAHVEQLPVAYMVCNFTPPVGERPALLTHDEVQTLFHEFGHGLQHMLTVVDYPPVAGINGVAWDAVELPSQFMENYCWEREALGLIAAHHQTGAPLPEALYQRMLAAKHFQSAMMMVRQLEFALFDFRLHVEFDADNLDQVTQILAQVRAQVAVVQPPEWNRFAHGFSHIFAGGYGAGYYSYKWAEVLSADAFSLFEENGVFDVDTGRAFRRNILEKGGSEDAMDLFVAFRGREPSIEPLLRHSGIAA